MTWTNAFDLGECTVTLNDWSFGVETPIVVWSGVMAKGDSQAVTIASSSDIGTLAVDADGVVSFECGYVEGRAYEILVTPSYAHDYPARISGMASSVDGSDINGANGEINATAATSGVDYLVWTIGSGASGQFSPDPLDMSALTGTRDLIGAYMITTGGI